MSTEPEPWKPEPNDTPEGSIEAAFSMWASEFAVYPHEIVAIDAERDWAIATLREQAATEARRELLAKWNGYNGDNVLAELAAFGRLITEAALPDDGRCPATREAIEEQEERGEVGCPICGQPAETHSSEGGA